MLGDIKQFNIVSGGVVLVVNAIDLGGGQVKFDIISQAGSAPADINAIYWGDSNETGSSQFNLGGPLNMNGSPIDFDGGVVISQPGSSGGTNVLAKPAYLTAGESYQVTYTGAADFFSTIDNLGVRATSTGFDGAGSIKGTDGVPTVIEAPKISINDQCVYEEDGTATFTVSLDHAYPYDITMNYASANGTAGATDFDAINGSFTILAGQTTYQLPVTILDDANPEDTEGFTINLSNASADIPGTDIALAIYDAVGDGTIKDTDVVVPPPPPPVEPALGLSPGAYKTVNGAGDIPEELTMSFDDFYGLDNNSERTWTDASVVYQDLTFAHVLSPGDGSAFAIGEGPADGTSPNMINGNAELALAREAAATAANFYSDEVNHNGFLVSLRDALDMDPAAPEAAVLAELQSQVQETFASNTAADYTNLTNALAATHD